MAFLQKYWLPLLLIIFIIYLLIYNQTKNNDYKEEVKKHKKHIDSLNSIIKADLELIEKLNKKDTVFVGFSVNNLFFAVNNKDYKGELADSNIIPLYHTPRGIAGYLNLRGEIYIIFDLRKFFGIENKSGSITKVLIFKTELGKPFGILIDEVFEDLKFSTDQIIEEDKNRIKSNFVFNKHIINGFYDHNDQCFILLSIDKLLNPGR